MKTFLRGLFFTALLYLYCFSGLWIIEVIYDMGKSDT